MVYIAVQARLNIQCQLRKLFWVNYRLTRNFFFSTVKQFFVGKSLEGKTFLTRQTTTRPAIDKIIKQSKAFSSSFLLRLTGPPNNFSPHQNYFSSFFALTSNCISGKKKFLLTPPPIFFFVPKSKAISLANSTTTTRESMIYVYFSNFNSICRRNISQGDEISRKYDFINGESCCCCCSFFASFHFAFAAI